MWIIAFFLIFLLKMIALTYSKNFHINTHKLNAVWCMAIYWISLSQFCCIIIWILISFLITASVNNTFLDLIHIKFTIELFLQSLLASYDRSDEVAYLVFIVIADSIQENSLKKIILWSLCYEYSKGFRSFWKRNFQSLI